MSVPNSLSYSFKRGSIIWIRKVFKESRTALEITTKGSTKGKNYVKPWHKHILYYTNTQEGKGWIYKNCKISI